MLIEGDFEDRVDLYFGSTAPGGYAWVIPKKNGANIGIGIQKRYAKKINLKSKAEEFFSRDGTLGGIEALATFIPFPLLAALFVSIGLRQRHFIRKMVGVAYLTLIIPLLGIGMGGANVLQQMLGGAIGGGFWGFLFAIRSSRAGAISK